jgi:TonB-linked SusC/RagA family outer membrane protein
MAIHTLRERMRCGRWGMWSIVVASAGMGKVPSVAAMGQQETVSVAMPATPGPEDRAANVALRRVISIHFDKVGLREALATIAAKGDLQLAFAGTRIPADATVSLTARGITVAHAFQAVLQGMGLEAVPLSGNRVALAPLGLDNDERWVTEAGARQGGPAIAGRVTDEAGHPLSSATITLEGTAHQVSTRTDGRYAIAGASPGSYQLTARLLGYAPLSKPVRVRADSTAEVDFTLRIVPTALEQIVTTAAGDQRRVELGNSIATINADSLTPETPINNMSDLLSGRAAGVEVLTGSGMAGTGTRIRIRGLSSISLSNDPIIYLDGVRVDNTLTSANQAGTYGYAENAVPSRLDDINPADIESIDILKGPSAATEYGTDASNGVIVIKTKHGNAGATQWNAYAEQGLNDMPAKFSSNYYAWGHTTTTPSTIVQCTLVAPFTDPSAPNLGAGTCVTDSVTRFSPLNNSQTTFFGTGTRGEYGLSVSGGSSTTRYYLSGNYTHDNGVLRMPLAVQSTLGADFGTSPLPEQIEPNLLVQGALRSNVTLDLSRWGDVTLSASYLSTTQRALYDGGLMATAEDGPGYENANLGYYQYIPPSAIFASSSGQSVRRFVGAGTLNVRPTSWLAAHATLGLDVGSQADTQVVFPGEDPTHYNLYTGEDGYRGAAQGGTSVYTVTSSATATVPITPHLTSTTTLGEQYEDRQTALTIFDAYGLPAGGNLSFNGVLRTTAAETGEEDVTVGSFLDQTFALWDRLFLTGAVRVDAGSGFGSNYQAAVYPKASASWVVFQSPQPTLRLRAAYGQSGVQPLRGASLTLFNEEVAVVNGASTGAAELATIGNPNLQPERQTEFEGGFDASTVNQRVTLALTFYNKQSHDAIVSEILPPSAGHLSQQVNVGGVRNQGIEATVTAVPVQIPALSWDVDLNASWNANKVTAIGGNGQPIIVSTYPNTVQQALGYPLYSNWTPDLTYSDANHDGIIEPSEVSLSSQIYYQGPSTPTRELSLGTGLTVLHGRLRLSTLFDYRGGNKLDVGDVAGFQSLYPLNQAEQNVQGSNLALQARSVAYAIALSSNNLDEENADFIRWREASISYSLPTSWMRSVHARSLSLVLLARNLALWTKYGGLDPEAIMTAQYGQSPDFVYANDPQPLQRYVSVRINAGF